MAGKATVNGEQSSYSGKWTYNINSLDEWIVKTHEKFGESGLVALAELVKSVTFHVGRGKGGKKQAHRPSGAAAIKRAAKKARNRKRSK